MSKEKKEKDVAKDIRAQDDKVVVGTGMGRKIERLRFLIGNKNEQEYHLMISPSEDGGVVVTWMAADDAHDDEIRPMSWDNGFAADFLGQGDSLGIEISISEIVPLDG